MISCVLRNTTVVIHLLENLGRVITRKPSRYLASKRIFSLIIFLNTICRDCVLVSKINRSIEKSASIGKSLFLHFHFFFPPLLSLSPSPSSLFFLSSDTKKRTLRFETSDTLRLYPNRVAIRRHLATAWKVRYEVSRRLTGKANERRNVPVDSKRTIDDYHKFIRDLSGSSIRLVLSPRQRERN